MNNYSENNINSGRRPLTIRKAHVAQKMASWLSRQNITPNQISVASTVFSLFAGVGLFFSSAFSAEKSWVWLVLAALFIQCRLLCNLFDGMVAIEGGKKTKSGELFNDMPDRISDAIIFVSAGYAASVSALGWSAALLAVMTAYVRTLNVSLGAPNDFKGPMAKQHRMAVMTIASGLAAFEMIFRENHYILIFALIIINIGCMLTIYRRTFSAYHYLEAR